MDGTRLVFLTGATGFIGSRVAAGLARRGHELRCLVRPSSDTTRLQRLGATLIDGDLTDQAALERGLDGADLAYHLAAIYDVGPVDARRLQRTNVEGTAAVLDAAERARVARLVYVSTSIVYGPADAATEPGDAAELEEDALPDENSPLATTYSSVYQRTKIEAHRLALDRMERGMPLVIAAPAFVYGPGDAGPVGRLVHDVVRGRLPALPDTSAWFSFVYVDDVAEGLVRLGLHPDARGSYVLGGQPARLHTFIERVARMAGRRPPRLRLPTPVVRATGSALDRVSRITGLRFSISREGVDQTTRGVWLCSSRRAADEIAWNPRPLDTGLPPTVAHALAASTPPREA